MYINSETSKNILNNIIKQKRINFQEHDLKKYKKEIQKLKKDYESISEKNSSDSKYKYFFFWELIRNKYGIKKITLKEIVQKVNANIKKKILINDIRNENRRLFNTTKLKSLGWKDKISFDRGIKITLKKFNAN